MKAEVKMTQGLSTKRCVIVTLTVVIAVLAVFGTISMMPPEPVWTYTEHLKITDVQFSEDFLTITVKSTGLDPPAPRNVATVTEVVVQPLNTTVTLCKVSMSVPIHTGEQVSICIRYDWISGAAYQITVTSEKGNSWLFQYAVAPEKIKF
jgi:hypothetical protein